MSKVTSKLQVTVPKAVAEQYKIKPGDEIEWEAAGDAIRVVPAKKSNRRKTGAAERLKIFDAATRRLDKREAARGPVPAAEERGWTRADLYDRGGAR